MQESGSQESLKVRCGLGARVPRDVEGWGGDLWGWGGVGVRQWERLQLPSDLSSDLQIMRQL